MRKSNPDFHHIRSYILMCVVSLTFSTIYAQTPEPNRTPASLLSMERR